MEWFRDLAIGIASLGVGGALAMALLMDRKLRSAQLIRQLEDNERARASWEQTKQALAATVEMGNIALRKARQDDGETWRDS